MSVQYHNYPTTSTTDVQLHHVSTSAAAISVYETPTGDSVGLHITEAVEYVNPLRFVSDGDQYLCFTFRAVGGQMFDVTVPEFDVAALIVSLQHVSRQQQVTE